jgi:hypothetical protein
MKYNKKRNTAFLYETLILEMTKATLNKDEERKLIALDIIKENFAKNSILHEEMDAYRSILETKGVTKEWANMILREAQRTYLSLHPEHVFQNQTHVINRVNKELGKDTFSNFTPNYKSLATIGQLFSVKTPVKTRVILESNIIEDMISQEETMSVEPVDNLVLKVFVESFNEKYDNLLNEQKDILFKYIFSFADDGMGLKIAINEEISRMKGVIIKNKTSVPELVEKFESLGAMLESFSKKAIDEKMLFKVLKTQEFCKELV